MLHAHDGFKYSRIDGGESRGYAESVPGPIARYRASRNYLWAGLAAILLTAVSAWIALSWPFAWVATGLLLFSAVVVFTLAFWPAIEVHEQHLAIYNRRVPWPEIRQVDRTGWISPLAVSLTLADKGRILVLYPGDLESSTRLLRQLRRLSREALIDGVPYRQFWGEAPVPERKQIAPTRYPMLLPEDEAEIERLFKRLRAVGHLESSDEK